MEKKVVIAIPTIGRFSHITVDAALTTMKKYASHDFHYIVSDDHTLLPEPVEKLKAVCKKHGADFYVNPHPVGDMSTNINNCFNCSDEEWLFMFDDGMLAPREWDVPFMRVLEKYNDHEFMTAHGPAKMGSVNILSEIVHYFFLSGIVKTRYSVEDWLLKWGPRNDYPAYYDIMREFYATYPNWWTGDCTWADVRSGFKKWFAEHPNWRTDYDFARYGQTRFPHIDPNANFYKDFKTSVFCAAQGCFRRELWQKMGGFYPGWGYFEGYFGFKAMELNYVPLTIPSPPFIHFPSIGTTDRADVNRGDIYKDVFVLCKELFGKSLEEMRMKYVTFATPELVQQLRVTIDPLLEDIGQKWH